MPPGNRHGGFEVDTDTSQALELESMLGVSGFLWPDDQGVTLVIVKWVMLYRLFRHLSHS